MTVVSESGMIFLKFLDDLEFQSEDEAELGWKKFEPAFELPYRGRDWSAQPDGITGGELQFLLPDVLGSADQLRNAVKQLQSLLYAA